LGHRSVAEAQRCISSREFAEWMAYDRLEPFGVVRGDLQAGIVASTLVNIHKKKDAAPSQPGDFILKFGGRMRRSAQDIYGMFKTWALRAGGKLIRK
jgi:hypothetical protein